MTQEQRKSLIPLFDIKPSEDYKEYVLVRCPKNDCPSHTKDEIRPFLVHKRTFTRPLRSKIKPETILFTRACPYCWRASRFR